MFSSSVLFVCIRGMQKNVKFLMPLTSASKNCRLIIVFNLCRYRGKHKWLKNRKSYNVFFCFIRLSRSPFMCKFFADSRTKDKNSISRIDSAVLRNKEKLMAIQKDRNDFILVVNWQNTQYQ